MRTQAALFAIATLVAVVACEGKDHDDAPAAAPAATQPAGTNESRNNIEIRTNNDTVSVGDQGTKVKVDVN